MNIFFIVVLVLNLLTEGLAAIALISGPQGIPGLGQIEGGMWSMNYGFAAIAIASAIIWIWPYRENLGAVSAVLGILLTFHTCIFIALAMAGDQIPGTVAHAIMTTLCLILFTQRSKWCTH